MSIGALFYICSLILFFLLGLGMQVIPRALEWAFFCLVLGMLLAGYPLPPWPHR